MTVNGDHIVSDVIRLCGGRNVCADLQVLAPSVSLESVLQRDPEVIVAGGEDGETQALAEQWQRWSGLGAVRGRHLYTIRRELLVRHTPRILDGAQRLCEILDAVRMTPGKE